MKEHEKKQSSKRIELPPSVKEVIWWPQNLTDEIKKNWPVDVKREGGLQLGRVQQGLEPLNFRIMSSVGVGVREIKIQDKDKSQYRLLYIATFPEAVYVIHVITKKTSEQTSKHDIDIARKRFNDLTTRRKLSKRNE